ncbi:MAG: hypothetical protein JWL61_3359 [Gemmatimonadetes bacterium]|nr:hypothetical protein [Gemmatimonadota bacterium]
MAIVLTLLGLFPAANYITTGVGLPWWSSTVEQWLIWGLVIATVAALLGRMMTDRVESAFAWAERVLLSPSSRAFGAAIFAVTCVLALYFGWRLFALEPVVGDEFAQRWQAHLLSKGHLSILADARAEFFSTIQSLEVRGRSFSQFPVGGPALLAIGVLAGVPWLVNPILAGVAAVALYDFIANIADELTARVSAILFALSPFVLFMSGSEMNHTGTLACLLIALAALARWTSADNAAHARWASIVMGASLGAAATIRPFDAAVVALMIGIFQLVTIRAKPWLLRTLIAQCVAGAIPVALLFAVNAATVGQPFAFAYDVLNGPEHRPGFHMTPLGFEHTPTRGFYMISAYLMKLDIGLFGWPVPAMLVIVATLALQRRATRWDYLLLALLAGLMVGYGAYWSESYFVGPRFLFAAVPVFVFYTARITMVVRERIDRPWLRASALLLVPLWVGAAWLIPPRRDQLFGTKRLGQMYTMPTAVPAIRDAVKSAGIRNAVVFLDEGWHSRLASRLRALGMRPLAAEQLVAGVDACNLQHALDAADKLEPSRAGERMNLVMNAVQNDVTASPLGQQVPNEQLAVVPGRPITADCITEAARIMSRGVSLAAMLPYVDLDADGKLGGSVVYARDFGGRNSLLVPSYGDRAWYAARASFVDSKVKITLDRIR